MRADDYLLIFCLGFPTGYWVGLNLANITNLDSAEEIIRVVSIGVVVGEEEEKPSFVSATLTELLLSLLVGAAVCAFATIYGGIIIFLMLAISHVLSPWLHDFLNDNAAFVWVVCSIAITMAYIGRLALKFVIKVRQLNQMIKNKQWSIKE